MYNTLLYGNGLTIAILNDIKAKIEDEKNLKYLSFESYLCYFLDIPMHKKEYTNFKKTMSNKSKKYWNSHDKSRIFLNKHKEDILKDGFEIWASSHIFDDISKEMKEYLPYIYCLYNYWYHKLKIKVLQQPKAKDILSQYVDKINNLKCDNILTLNFDTLLDDKLDVNHLHGKFKIPYNKFKDIVLYSNEKKFEYSYLFGGNGEEKRYRISNIKIRKQSKYNLDFFYNNDINWGDLLIYGVSFRYSKIIPKDLKEEFSNLYLVDCIDGHIIVRLEELYRLKNINSITIAYYSQSSLKHYKELFNKTKIKDLITYKKCNEIL